MKTMKMLFFAATAIALLTPNVLAVGFLGAPTADSGAGKWSLGYEYSYSTQDTEKTNAKSTAGPFKFGLEDFNLQRHYATVGYGLTDNWDIFIKGGIADLKAQGRDYDLNDKWGINYDNDLALGFATRYTLFKQQNMDWGIAVQLNWLDTELSKRSGTDKLKYDYDGYDVIVSTGPTFKFDSWKLYFGPYYYYLDGDYAYTRRDNSGAILYKESADIEAENSIGLFVGTDFQITQNLNWTVEFSTHFEGYGIGTGIYWKF